MNAISRTLFFGVCVLCSGCSSSAVAIRDNIVPDIDNCRPKSDKSSDVSKSQAACHQGVSGAGLQVILSSTKRVLSFSSDTTQQELVSIYAYGKNIKKTVGPVKFDAFYSRGMVGLTGKTGCVGILDDGSVEIVAAHENSSPVLAYNLRFRLVSPLGWPGDCDLPYHLRGVVALEE